MSSGGTHSPLGVSLAVRQLSSTDVQISIIPGRTSGRHAYSSSHEFACVQDRRVKTALVIHILSPDLADLGSGCPDPMERDFVARASDRRLPPGPAQYAPRILQ